MGLRRWLGRPPDSWAHGRRDAKKPPPDNQELLERDVLWVHANRDKRLEEAPTHGARLLLEVAQQRPSDFLKVYLKCLPSIGLREKKWLEIRRNKVVQRREARQRKEFEAREAVRKREQADKRAAYRKAERLREAAEERARLRAEAQERAAAKAEARRQAKAKRQEQARQQREQAAKSSPDNKQQNPAATQVSASNAEPPIQAADKAPFCWTCRKPPPGDPSCAACQLRQVQQPSKGTLPPCVPHQVTRSATYEEGRRFL